MEIKAQGRPIAACVVPNLPPGAEECPHMIVRYVYVNPGVNKATRFNSPCFKPKGHNENHQDAWGEWE